MQHTYTAAGTYSVMIEARDKGGPFKSLFDFCERVPIGLVNRATVEALIKCGAFDSIHGMDQRAAMVEALESGSPERVEALCANLTISTRALSRARRSAEAAVQEAALA